MVADSFLPKMAPHPIPLSIFCIMKEVLHSFSSIIPFYLEEYFSHLIPPAVICTSAHDLHQSSH